MTDPIVTLDEVRRDHNVVAAFRDLDAARQAILSLEKAGVDPDAISLLGAAPLDDGEEGATAVGADVAKGAATGAAGAAAAGALTSLVIPGIGPVIAAGLGALAGSAVGGVTGGIAGIGDSEAWKHTFEAVDQGTFAVGVHSDDSDTVEQGAEVLAGEDPMAMNRFSSE